VISAISAVSTATALRYEADGWHIVATPIMLGSEVECTDASGNSFCGCGNPTVDNANEPCGPNGTSHRAEFP
jgi:hypothetical protein